MPLSSRRAWLKRWAPLPVASLVPSQARVATPPRPLLQARPRLGINIAGVAYWGSELPFVDVIRTSSPWTLGTQGASAPTPNAKPELDQFGWVTRLPEGSWAEKRLTAAVRIPVGRWTTLYEGRGRLEMRGQAQTLSNQPGRIEFRVAAHDAAALSIRLLQTDPADPVRDIRVVMPGHEASHADEPWNPSLLTRWQGMASLRFMDLMATNHSTATTWALRPTPQHDTFANRGVAAEWLIDLANRLNADPWFCMPHLADDDYVAQFAALVKERLNPRLRAWVEHSNEVWNRGFGQAQHAAKAGIALGLGTSADVAQQRYHAQRSVQIFQTWERVLGGRSRLVRVLGAHTANPWAAESLLATTNTAESCDVLAIAPYVGLMPSPASRPSSDDVSRWPLEKLFTELASDVAKQKSLLQRHAALCRRHGLLLVAYEGGQHLVGVQGGENNDALTALFTAANRDMRMAEVYRQLYAAWDDAGGDLFCHYSSVARPGKWGCWGMLEEHDQSPVLAPKHVASLVWARSHGQY